MDEIDELFQRLPLSSTLACIFYLSTIFIIGWKPARIWLDSKLTPPIPTHNTFYRGLDGYRGIAALWIALFHFYQWCDSTFLSSLDIVPRIASGDKAVPIFVVLTGYLIWVSVGKIKDISDLKKYAQNRALRVLPAYYTAIVFIFVFAIINDQPFHLRNLVSDLFLARIFGSSYFTTPQAWSLFIEIVFYIAAPFIFVFVQRGRLAFFIVSIFLLSYFENHQSASRELCLWKYFFMGMSCAELISFNLVSNKILNSVLTLTGAVLLYCDIFLNFPLIDIALSFDKFFDFGFGNRTSYGMYNLTIGLGFSLLLLGTLQSKLVSTLFSLPGIKYLGVISYGIFIWHSFIIAFDLNIKFDGFGGILKPDPLMLTAMPSWVLFLVIIPSLFTIGTASYLLIERPFLKRRSIVPNRLQ